MILGFVSFSTHVLLPYFLFLLHVWGWGCARMYLELTCLFSSSNNYLSQPLLFRTGPAAHGGFPGGGSMEGQSPDSGTRQAWPEALSSLLVARWPSARCSFLPLSLRAQPALPTPAPSIPAGWWWGQQIMDIKHRVHRITQMITTIINSSWSHPT